MGSSLAAGMRAAHFEMPHARSGRTAHDPDVVVAAGHGGMTRRQFLGRQAAVTVGVHAGEMVGHRCGELFPRDLAVAVLVEAAGTVGAHDHEAGVGLGWSRRCRRLLYQDGGKGDQGQHERSAPVVVRPLFDHGPLAVVFQQARRLFQC